MKFAHISDLHLGIELNNHSLQEDQTYILNQIAEICVNEKIDALVIAGDIFDRAIAPTDSITMFNDFLEKIQKAGIKVYAISGNHDSAERIAPGRNFMTGSGIYFSSVYDGKVTKTVFKDKFGDVNFYLMPFIRPGLVKHYVELKGETIDLENEPWNKSIEYIIKEMGINTKQRNVLVAHQNIQNVGDEDRSESETKIYGGLDGISVDLFKDFDYTALGHIHNPLNVAKNIRYCGTPLKYSLSEVDQKKSLTVVEMGDKGDVKVCQIPLKPVREMRQIKGTFAEIAEDFKTTKLNKDDFVYVTLKDETEIPDVMTKLWNMYPNAFGFRYDNTRTKHSGDLSEIRLDKAKTPLENFEQFFENRSGMTLTDEQKKIMADLIEEIWGAAE